MIRLFLEFNNRVIQLPVNPEELMISSESNNKTSEIVSLGEISLLRTKKLATLSIDCFFPANQDAPYVLTKGKFEEPQFYVDFIELVRNANQPMRFIITDTGVNMLVSIEGFEYGLKAGDDDLYYKLQLKEYKPYGSKVLKLVTPETTTQPAQAVAQVPERPKTGFAIGDVVIANGTYYATSYGEKPSNIFNNFTGKINLIVQDKTRPYRYHVTTLDGGFRGWVSDSQLKHK